MQKLEIKGGRKISGTVVISGSKNATLPILASTILTNKKVIIKNIPIVRDVETMAKLLSTIGSAVKFDQKRKKIEIFNKKPLKTFAPYYLLKISIFFLFLSNFTADPIVLKSSAMVNTSFTKGIFLIVTFLFVNMVDANIGSVEFFEPEIVMVPNIFLPPLISNFCI